MAKSLYGGPALALRAWTEVNSGALLWKADVTIATDGYGELEVDGVCIFQKDGRRWASLPAEKVIDKDNRPRLDSRGRPLYRNIVKIANKEDGDLFSRDVIALVEEAATIKR